MKAVTCMGKRDVRVSVVADPKIEEPSDALVPVNVPLEEAPAAYEMFQEKRDNVIKVVLHP